jgi:hypothetical protein
VFSLMCGPDHRQTAFVDELAERVDHRLHVSPRQALHDAERHLDRAVDHPRLVAGVEHQIEGAEVDAVVVHRGAVPDVVDQEAELDRFGLAHARHGRHRSSTRGPGSVARCLHVSRRPRVVDTLAAMYIGLGVFAVLAVVCVIAGAMAMKRRRDDYEGDDGGMSEAEFRKYEGFDD